LDKFTKKFALSKIMFVYTHFLRVRYAETDQMGVVYHGNYITYLEVARAEAIRSLGITYKEMELGGVAMPVVDVNIQYLKPAHYDEELRIVVTVKSFPDKRLCADYEIFNAQDQKLTTASVTLLYYDSRAKKVCRAPEFVLKALAGFFSENA